MQINIYMFPKKSYHTNDGYTLLFRYATETNRLIVRLDKLLTSLPGEAGRRREHEKAVVAWVDEVLASHWSIFIIRASDWSLCVRTWSSCAPPAPGPSTSPGGSTTAGCAEASCVRYWPLIGQYF